MEGVSEAFGKAVIPGRCGDPHCPTQRPPRRAVQGLARCGAARRAGPIGACLWRLRRAPPLHICPALSFVLAGHLPCDPLSSNSYPGRPAGESPYHQRTCCYVPALALPPPHSKAAGKGGSQARSRGSARATAALHERGAWSHGFSVERGAGVEG